MKIDMFNNIVDEDHFIGSFVEEEVNKIVIDDVVVVEVYEESKDKKFLMIRSLRVDAPVCIKGRDQLLICIPKKEGNDDIE